MGLQEPAAVQKSDRGLAATFVWGWMLSRQIWSCAPGRLLVAMLARAFAQLAQLFALFIPLKILIIMGSNHIPAYLQNVMTPESRGIWIAGMTVATLLLYMASIVLDWVAGRMEGQAARQFMQALSGACVPAKEQRGLIRRMIFYLSKTHASITIVGLCLLGLLIINPLILLILTGILIVQFAITAWSARRRPARVFGWPAREASRNPTYYFRTLAALGFLAVFVLLLADYWITGTLDVLTAILMLLLGRRFFQSAANAAIRILILQDERAKIDEFFGNKKPV